MVPEAVRLQLELERIGVAAGNVMVRLPGPDPDDIPRVAIYRHRAGWAFLCDETITGSARMRLRSLDAPTLFDDQAAVEAVIGPTRRAAYRTHTFDVVPDATGENVVAEPGLWAVYDGGRRVAWASSSREGPRAAELAVETLPEYRRRGYARRVASAWAAARLAAGKTCFYSYLIDNHPSAMLARSLGVVWQFDVATYA